jgi:hypothetical protein
MDAKSWTQKWPSLKRHQEELQRRILDSFKILKSKTDRRVESVVYNSAASTVSTTVK